MVDLDRGTSSTNQVILVEGGRITAIGGNVAVPAGAQVIDLSSSTVSPGLVHAHTHLCMHGGAAQPRRRQQVVDRLRRAFRIGVTLVYGTDAIERVPGKTRGEVAMTGIAAWVEAGVPAKAILQAMTTNATRLLGVDKVRGTLAPDMAADLIATTDDPLSNIETPRNVSFVMKDGKVIRR